MIQRCAARFVCRDYRCEAGVVSSLLEKLGWQTLQERRKSARLTLFYKIVNKHVAVDTGNLLRASTHNTRSNSALSPAYKLLKTVTNIPFFLEQSPIGINSPQTREVKSVNAFKTLLCVPAGHRPN